ncbi:MAG TPA: serine hydrolase [Ignavibacteria bacterium]|nr:serine hydrolase [Ignavibacteria bacterium]
MKLKFIKSVLFFTLVISFLLTGSNKSFAGLDPLYEAALQSSLNQLRTSYNIPGMSAIVILPEGTWEGTSGISDSGSTMTYSHSFGIGSITKNIIAATILKLQEKNLLNIDDKIIMYLPRYDNIDSNITIRELLQHTSGIYNFTNNPQYSAAINANLDSVWNPENVLQFVLAPNFQHGTSWAYSNTNYILLGLIIEEVYKMPLHEAYQKLLLTNHFLGGLSLFPFEEYTGPLAHNWVDLNGDGILDDASFIPKTAIFSGAWGAGAIISRPQKLAFYAMQLFGGELLEPQSMQQMTTFRNVSFGNVNGYGLGLMRYTNVAGRTVWGHGGNVFGYASIMMHVPQDTITAVICSNRDLSTTNFGLPFMNTVITQRPVGIQPISQEIPSSFELKQNYPNPFNPETTIEFKISGDEFTNLNVYDINGRLVETLVNEKLQAGIYKMKWSGANVSSGVYYYTLKTENFSETKKMILLK